MNNNIIEIKKQQKNWFIKGIVYLLVMLLSLLIALLPLVINFGTSIQIGFHITGSIIFLPFAALFVILIINELNPGTAMTLTAHGFIDIINIGANIQIEWTNVSAVKMLGKENMPFLGITLENPDIILAKMKKSKAAEITENIEQNLPTILIPQNSVRISIKELKNIFIKFVREARVLETDTPPKTKNNPFTTDDVLRAFGQLPKDEPSNEETNNTETEDVEENIESAVDIATEEITAEAVKDISEVSFEPIVNSQDDQLSPAIEETVDVGDLNVTPGDSLKNEVIPKFRNDINQPFTVPDAPQPNDNIENSGYTPVSDAFYESLRAKAIVKPKAVEENVNDGSYKLEDESSKTQATIPAESTEPIISTEIEELLNQARSSRITEIEKLLNDEDVPYSIVREKKPDEQSEDRSEKSVTNDLTDEYADSVPDNSLIDSPSDEQSDIENDDIHPEKELQEDLPMEDKLAVMIADAIKSTEADDSDLTINNNVFSEDPNAATREFVLNLSKALENSSETE